MFFLNSGPEKIFLDQSFGVVEYTDSISEEG